MIVHLLGGLSEAIKFLVKKKIVHRDIKPDNILVLNGCYKLADFGMAMAVNNFEDRLQFANGTREYAHPSIFKCMVAYEVQIYPHKKTFLPTCDLWSIGATVFHAIKGFSPFVPEEGCRKNARIMYKILDEKPHGAIFARKRGEKVTYFDELPKTEGFNEIIRKQLNPLLAVLLEVRKFQFIRKHPFFVNFS